MTPRASEQCGTARIFSRVLCSVTTAFVKCYELEIHMSLRDKSSCTCCFYTQNCEVAVDKSQSFPAAFRFFHDWVWVCFCARPLPPRPYGRGRTFQFFFFMTLFSFFFPWSTLLFHFTYFVFFILHFDYKALAPIFRLSDFLSLIVSFYP